MPLLLVRKEGRDEAGAKIVDYLIIAALLRASREKER
jgi:hypothetical protein